MGKYRKAIVAVVGAAITTALTIPDLPGNWFQMLSVVSAMVTAFSVWAVENDPMPPAPPRA